jgi:hypothetical protein
VFGFGSLFGSVAIRLVAWRRASSSQQWPCGGPADPFIHGGGRVGLRFATFRGQRQSVRSRTGPPLYYRRVALRLALDSVQHGVHYAEAMGGVRLEEREMKGHEVRRKTNCFT